MSPAISKQTTQSAEFQSAPEVYSLEGWTVRHYDVVDSTNLVAAPFPAWTAVRANTQTGGRGRFQRKWISDAGGLWFSAVVPVKSTSAPGTLPLAAGLALCDSLRKIGVTQLRMRWPNDVLIGNRKLAGLLLDQFAPALCVVGIGINVLNQPEVMDASLNNQTARLADLIPAQPELSELMALVLRNLRCVVQDLERAGFESLIPRVNQLWLTPRRVELDLDGALHRGVFTGVDREGHLMLLDDKASSRTYAAYQVRHLQEI